jgi:hypothetical protein
MRLPSPSRTLGRRGKVQFGLVFTGPSDDLPEVSEAALVAVAEAVQDETPLSADAGRQLEQLDQLRRRQETGERLGRSCALITYGNPRRIRG